VRAPRPQLTGIAKKRDCSSEESVRVKFKKNKGQKDKRGTNTEKKSKPKTSSFPMWGRGIQKKAPPGISLHMEAIEPKKTTTGGSKFFRGRGGQRKVKNPSDPSPSSITFET